MFPAVGEGAGMYESFYVRAVAGDTPEGVWLRYTVHKRKGQAPRGSVWCTVFGAEEGGGPWMGKETTGAVSAPGDAWIAVGESKMGDGYMEGGCCGAGWRLGIQARAAELRHLPRGWMYGARLPRTKLTSPAPDAMFEGELSLPDGRRLDVDGWRGMVGHNWGAEHAERWVWLHGVGFGGDEQAWLDVAVGRVRVGGWLTPWVANGAVGLEGRRWRLGGVGRRGLRVRRADAEGCELELGGRRGVGVRVRVRAPRESRAGWVYADPDGKEHEVMNCSVASVEMDVEGLGRAKRSLETSNGGAYELGRRKGEGAGLEREGVKVAPYAEE